MQILCNFYAWCMAIPYANSMPGAWPYPMQFPCHGAMDILCNFHALVRCMEPRLGDVLAFGSMSQVDIEHRPGGQSIYII